MDCSSYRYRNCLNSAIVSNRELYAKMGFTVMKTEEIGGDCELLFMRRGT
jgi:hypothetical protein